MSTDPIASGPLSRRRTRDAPRRAIRALRSQLAAARRRTLVATGVAVIASLTAVGAAVQPEPSPEPVLLGQGTAGVRAPAPPPEPALAARAPDAATARADSAIGEGEASYYGDELAGRPTASGEPFNPARLTAAHRTLPLGTRLRVTNVRTDESVVVTVNDRGPFAGHRVVDLSKRAAREIGMLQTGTAPVRLEIVRA